MLLNLSDDEVRFLIYILENNNQNWSNFPNDYLIQNALKHNKAILAEINSKSEINSFKARIDKQSIPHIR